LNIDPPFRSPLSQVRSASYYSAIEYFYRTGLEQAEGIDLDISIQERLEQFAIMKNNRTLSRPSRLRKGDPMHTALLPDALSCRYLPFGD